MSELSEKQLDHELHMVQRGLDRYYIELAASRQSGKEYDGGAGATVLFSLMQRAVPEIQGMQDKAREKWLRSTGPTGGRLDGTELLLLALPADRLAYITCRMVLLAAGSGKTFQIVGREIGWTVMVEAQWAEARPAEAKRAHAAREAGVEDKSRRNRIQDLIRTVKGFNPRHVRKWILRLEDLQVKEWPLRERTALGISLAQSVIGVCPETFKVRSELGSYRGAPITVENWDLTEEARARLSASHQHSAEMAPWLLPMMCRPKRWAWDPEKEKLTGGYLAIHTELVRQAHRHPHVTGEASAMPKAFLQAVNVIQETPWRVNQPILDVLRVAYDHDIKELLPITAEQDLPPHVPSEVWAEMSHEERSEVKARRMAVHDHNRKGDAKRGALVRTEAAATEMQDHEGIWFPHSVDWRTRLYPLSQDLHPQGDDICRGLLEFGEGKPLKDGGIRWLVYQAAGSYGIDKATRTEQLDWYMEHIDAVHAVAVDPLGAGFDFWRRADKPWQFLAACLDLDRAPSCGSNFTSHLPVDVDGSCNGLQHLSAMILDPTGAEATNLCAIDERRDVYQIVADKVSKTVELDYLRDVHALQYETPAVAWRGQVTRKVVKRAVMTTPYGLTPIGRRDQLLDDGHCKDLQGNPHKNASYLSKILGEAIHDTVIAARDVMEWMQDNAAILAKNGRAIRWRTPIGVEVTQQYVRLRRTRVVTLLGSVNTRRIKFWEAGDELDTNKQRLSVAPNIIHGFDASHLMMTVLKSREAGITSFRAIHDSFGTHACDMDKLNAALRETFVEIYSENQLERLYESFKEAAAGDFPLIPPPERGEFDITEVRRAPFFFA